MKNTARILYRLMFTLLIIPVALVYAADPQIPIDVALAEDGGRLMVALAEPPQIQVWDTESAQITDSWSLPRIPSGIAIKGNSVWVSCSDDNQPAGLLLKLDQNGSIESQVDAGQGTHEPRLSPDGSQLAILNRWDNTVSVFDSQSMALIATLEVLREPSVCDFTPDGEQLWVANFLPVGRSDGQHVASAVSVFDCSTWDKLQDIDLPNGASAVTGLRVAADGAYVYVVHNAAAYQLPTNRLIMGWQNAALMSVIETESLTVVTSVMLDDVERGAANPWDLELTPDGSTLVVAHAGTHEVSLIDEAKLREVFWRTTAGQPTEPVTGEYYVIESGRSGLVLQVQGAATSNGANVQQGTYQEEAEHQQFMLIEGSQDSLMFLARGASKFLHIAGDSSADVANLEIHGTIGPGTRFTVEPAGGDYYFIVNQNSNKLLDVEGNSTAEGANIIQYTRHEGSNQQWSFTPVEGQTLFTDVTGDFTALLEARQRVRLEGNGPRALAVGADQVYALEVFSETISIVPLVEGLEQQVTQWNVTDDLDMTDIRQGEMVFCDATRCFQHWQSCVSCHPGARSDALNWDLGNDGMGNDKNTKSFVHSFDLAPAMATGVRADAATAVRAGFRYIQFVVVDEEVPAAVDTYLSGLQPVPSPHLVNGQLSQAAQRGQSLFEFQGCANCHTPPFYSNQMSYTMGTLGPRDTGPYDGTWDTPTLIECWRSAPYLHDGRCATLEEVFTQEGHGLMSSLSDDEISDLISFIQSL